MAASRPPGSWGLEANPLSIDDGTLCRAPSPTPGSVGIDSHRNIARGSGTFGDRALETLDDLTTAVADFRGSERWSRLQPIAFQLLGQQSFGLGAVYGIGENVIGSVAELALLAKTFLLADLYDRVHRPGLAAAFGPVGLLQRALAEVSMRGFGAELKQAHEERDALVEELRYAITHADEVFGSIKDSYVSRWNEFERLIQDRTLSSQFRAGRIFGEVLLEVLLLIGGGYAVIKAASKIPRLARLAQLRIPRPTAGSRPGGTVTPKSIGEPRPVTPSRAAGTESAPPTVAPKPLPQKPALKTKPMLDAYKGEHLPGNNVWGGKRVTYLNDAERAAYRLEFKDGKIYDANGRLFDTSTASSAHSGGGNAIFVMDAKGNVFASKTQIVGEFHHSSLAAGQPVAAAGELRVEQGVLKAITDKSGHYRPTSDMTEQALKLLQSNGVDTSGVSKTVLGRPPLAN